ncbi:MAG TPA: 2-amino-4-hydroxy-6-hydroxymethyldihydropteridine diphosphokinase [Fimbriiglobus sp.]|jgi:2-amino-4-hydroxy-6-hydroxymethyldihydropteridine diphosphokinase
MATAYLALGSNLGDRWANLTAAVQRLRREPELRVVATSEVYETAPVNCPPEAGAFLNSVVAVETERSPENLLALLLQIERSFGRIRTVPNSPRTLDLDILLYGDRVIDTPDLVVPHPRMHERDFVLSPLADLSGRMGRDAVHPVLKKSARELCEAFLGRYADQSLPRPRRFVEKRTVPQILSGLRALVTGSTSGIGAAIASHFEQHGAAVVRHGRRTKLEESEPFVSADLRDSAQLDRLAVEAWGAGLDVLVCNAGADTLTGDAAKWSFDEKLEALLDVDLKGTMRLSRDIGARMKTRGRGVILTIGWDQAETGMEGDSGQLFAAVKGAVMSFTRSLALDLAPEVRVNCLAPGWIRTAWGETAGPAWQERVRRETPLGVWGLPEDVAAAAVWLASPAAAYVTGQTIKINGGAVK